MTTRGFVCYIDLLTFCWCDESLLSTLFVCLFVLTCLLIYWLDCLSA